MKSRHETLEPSFIKPNTESVDPMRVKLLIDRQLPTLVKSNSETELASFVIP
jgi:hypothetical protein